MAQEKRRPKGRAHKPEYAPIEGFEPRPKPGRRRQPPPEPEPVQQGPALAAMGVLFAVAVMAALALLSPDGRPVQSVPLESTSVPHSAFVDRPTPTPAPAPTDRPPTPTPGVWTEAASWSPTGEYFAMSKPITWIMITRRGERCQLQLPPDPNGGIPKPWVPCSLLDLRQ